MVIAQLRSIAVSEAPKSGVVIELVVTERNNTIKKVCKANVLVRRVNMAVFVVDVPIYLPQVKVLQCRSMYAEYDPSNVCCYRYSVDSP